jgi:hypothetical protein
VVWFSLNIYSLNLSCSFSYLAFLGRKASKNINETTSADNNILA